MVELWNTVQCRSKVGLQGFKASLPNLISAVYDSNRETTAVGTFNKMRKTFVSPYSSEAEHLSRKQGVVSSILTVGIFCDNN